MEDTPWLSTVFRHSGWRHSRRLVCESMVRTHQPDSRIRGFADCGSHSYVLRSFDDPPIYRIAGSSCHDRFCLPCAKERSHAIALNVLELAQEQKTRFLTFTIASRADTLAENLDHLYRSFKALRRTAFWRQRCRGGVAFLEITYNATKRRWHPHFHVLQEGLYIPGQHLRALWHKITGDSYIVDITLVKDKTIAAKYVTKYASKPFNNTFLGRPHALDEAIVALKGRKLLMTFGTWRGITLVRTVADGAWEHYATLEAVITCAAHGDGTSQTILAALTDSDLTELYARAPPMPESQPPKRPPDRQLTWFGTWQDNGTWKQHGI